MMTKIPHLVGLSLTVSLLVVGCRSQPSPPPTAAVQPGDTITILGTLTGVGETKLRAALAPFTEATGVEIIYEGTDAFTTLIPVRVDSGNPPDMALFPQPGLMLDFAEAGQMVPITDFIDRTTLAAAYDEYLINLVSLDNNVYGLWMRADVKSLVWYNPQAFAAKGYTVPETWAELQALSDRIVADGRKPAGSAPTGSKISCCARPGQQSTTSGSTTIFPSPIPRLKPPLRPLGRSSATPTMYWGASPAS
jgi:alpha-glucoside transport system substrate-binding protein